MRCHLKLDDYNNGGRDLNPSFPLRRNLNAGNRFAVKIEWVSASYKLLYSHSNDIDSMNMLCLVLDELWLC